MTRKPLWKTCCGAIPAPMSDCRRQHQTRNVPGAFRVCGTCSPLPTRTQDTSSTGMQHDDRMRCTSMGLRTLQSVAIWVREYPYPCGHKQILRTPLLLRPQAILCMHSDSAKIPKHHGISASGDWRIGTSRRPSSATRQIKFRLSVGFLNARLRPLTNPPPHSGMCARGWQIGHSLNRKLFVLLPFSRKQGTSRW